MKRLIVGLTGASGIIYGIRFLEVCKKLGVETHLVVSQTCSDIIAHETELSFENLCSLASVCYDNKDLGSAVASGSFQTDGMVIIPCSMKTLSAVANGYADSLICRASMCTLKEKRRLVVVPRETPMDLASLRNMVAISEAGGTVLPASPGFYHKPEHINDLVDFIVGKALDQFKISHELYTRWK